MFLIQTDVSHMPSTELENDSESVWEQTKLLTLWQVGIDNLVAQLKTLNCL